MASRASGNADYVTNNPAQTNHGALDTYEFNARAVFGERTRGAASPEWGNWEVTRLYNFGNPNFLRNF